MSKPLAITKPKKRMSIYEEVINSGNEDDGLFIDSHNKEVAIHDTRKDTLMLAQFLATTGPEEYGKQSNIKKQQQFKSAVRLLNKLRKNASRTDAIVLSPKPPGERKKHIPLPVHDIHNNPNNDYFFSNETKSVIKNKDENNLSKSVNKDNFSSNNQRLNFEMPTPLITTPGILVKKQNPSSTRDSGIYSEVTLEKECYTSTAHSPVSPLPEFTTVLNDLKFPRPPFQFKLPENANYPSRPAPLPPSSAGSPTTTSTVSSSTNTSDSSSRVRTVPEAALNRRSARLRHVQVQTTQTNVFDKKETPMSAQEVTSTSNEQTCCPHCKSNIAKGGRVRRPSCPASLASGPALLTSKDTEDSKMLLSMIIKLKTQLEEEKQCRIRLEKAVRQQQKESDEKRNQLALEKEKWALDSLWLNDRIALLPE